MHKWAPLGCNVKIASCSAEQKLIICLKMTHLQSKNEKELEIAMQKPTRNVSFLSLFFEFACCKPVMLFSVQAIN